ncbi:hypothetical protein GF376_03380 [Candidatus Peregrinibacteria bacterium]|nr:hypothetical protein [Candidatus Peregrinibacteria bacterium]
MKIFKFLGVAGLLFAVPVAFAAFSDVENSKYQDAINYLEANGVVEGYEDGTFKPRQNLNRAEFLKIMVEVNYDESDFAEYSNSRCFPDVEPGVWYTKYVCFGAEKGIVEGYPDGTFRPGNSINFVESAKIVTEAFGVDVFEDSETWYKPYVEYLESQKAVPVAIGSSWDKLINRGEMAEISYRLMAEDTSKDSTENFCTEAGDRLGAVHYKNHAYCCEELIIETPGVDQVGSRGWCIIDTEGEIPVYPGAMDFPNFDTIEEYIDFIHGNMSGLAETNAPEGLTKIGINLIRDGVNGYDFVYTETDWQDEEEEEFYIQKIDYNLQCLVEECAEDEESTTSWYGPFEGDVGTLLENQYNQAYGRDAERKADINTIASAIILYLTDNEYAWGPLETTACLEDLESLEPYLGYAGVVEDPTGAKMFGDLVCESGYLFEYLNEDSFSIWADTELNENGNVDYFVESPGVSDGGDLYVETQFIDFE